MSVKIWHFLLTWKLIRSIKKKRNCDFRFLLACCVCRNFLHKLELKLWRGRAQATAALHADDIVGRQASQFGFVLCEAWSMSLFLARWLSSCVPLRGGTILDVPCVYENVRPPWLITVDLQWLVSFSVSGAHRQERDLRWSLGRC